MSDAAPQLPTLPHGQEAYLETLPKRLENALGACLCAADS